MGPGEWREKRKKVENETQTRFDMEYGEKHSKTWKMGNAHCRIWNMAKKLQIIKNEKLKIIKNEKHTLQGTEYCEKH